MELAAVRPMLEVSNLEETIAFYRNILRFALTGTWPDEEAKQWAELTAGNVRLMFMTRCSEAEQPQPVMTGQLYLYPPDVDALWEQLRERVEIAWPLETMSYGMREFAIRDCNGYLLTFGQGAEESEQ